MRAAVLLIALLSAAPKRPPPPPPPAPAPAAVAPKARASKDAGADAPVTPSAALKPPAVGHVAPGETKCGSCHVTTSWTDVKFNHDRTGFPLTGGHATVACKGCHSNDFEKPVPLTCGGCHTDVHAADLGARCEGCHDTASWASRFDADAHRRTNFPLVGAHAAIPCLECHGESSSRRFSRPAVECTACHAADLARTRNDQSVDHIALGFTASCRSCHNAFRFKPATFAGHDSCYFISSGPHSGRKCLDCHTSLAVVSAPGSCSTGTADCKKCHECNGAGSTVPTATDLDHRPPKTAAPVPGYSCGQVKCYRCHQEVIAK